MEFKGEELGHHISQQFNSELQGIRDHMLSLGGMVERQIADAVAAMTEGDSALAETVLVREDSIDLMEVEIDEECATVIALRQPAASDLRLVIAVSKAVTDLERIGDEANKIARFGLQLIEEGQSPRGYIEMRHIANHVREMLRDALDAFARFDVDAAIKVVREDRSVDDEYRSAMRSLVTFMMEDPRSISKILNVIWALRALERVGDHARNIAEQVIYLVRGKDVRHKSLEQIQEVVKR